MKILLTGASGLVGRNLLEHPRSALYKIFAPSSTDLNLLDFSSTKAYLAKICPDMVIHAAGRVGGIQANIKSPVDFLVDNLEMGKNLIIASRDLNIRNFLNIGSSCMYPKGYVKPLTEDLILAGYLEPTNEGYALAKIACQRLCDYISRDKDFKYKTIIPCNIYGRHDSFSPLKSHLLPAIITKLHQAILSQSEVVQIWGDGNARR